MNKMVYNGQTVIDFDNLATKDYVNENSSNIDMSTIQENLQIYPIYYDVPTSNPFWVSKGSALELLFINKINEVYAKGIENFIVSIIDSNNTKDRYDCHIKVSTIGNNKSLTITALNNFLRDSSGLITCRCFGNYSYSGGYKFNTSTGKFEHSATSGNAFALFKYEDDGGAYVKPSDVLTKTNSTSYTPSSNYHPATKKYVDDLVNSRDVLEGTYNDTDVTAGYDFSVGSVNALIDTLNNAPQMIQVNLTREFEDRTDINSVMADIGFNSSVSTDGTTTDEVSLHYVVVSQGMYLRFYGSATLTDGHITSPLHCFSEDYNG